MAGKPATISDLFTPMKSIQTCMEAQGTAINDNLVALNNSLLGCASDLSSSNRLLQSAVKTINKTLVDSFKELNDITAKQVSSSVSATGGIASAISSSIGSGLDNLSNQMITVNQQLEKIVDYVKKIEKKGKETITDKIKGKLKLSNIKAPDVSGGKGVGDLAKALAQAAKTIDGISLPKAMLIKIKANKIIGGLLDVFEEHKELLNAAEMKKRDTSVKTLNEISDSISYVAAGLAAVMPLAPFAILGAKLSKSVITNLLTAIEPLANVKNLEESKIAAQNLKEISNAILKFNANMALTAILAVPAAIGVAATGGIVRLALFMLKPLATAKATKEMAEAALNLKTIATSTLHFSAAMALNAILAIPAAIGMALSGLLIRGSVVMYEHIGQRKMTVDIRSAAMNMNLISLSILGFSVSLVLSTMIIKYLITGGSDKIEPMNLVALGSTILCFGLMIGAASIYKHLGSADNVKSTLLGGLSVTMMAVGLMAFALSFYVVHQISKNIVGNWEGKKDVAALVMDVGIMALMMGSLYVFKNIGAADNTRQVINGGLSILIISLGFIAFSTSLYFSSKLIKELWKSDNGKMDWMELLKTVAVFGLMYSSMVVFKTIGENSESVLKGAGVSLAMSVGLLVFGLGLSFAIEPVKNNNANDLWLLPVLLGAFALEFGVMGLAAAEIALGGAASLAMSVGLAVFGIGLSIYVSSTSGVEWKDVDMMISVIGNIGLEYAALGLLSVPIALGAAAMAGTGKSLEKLGEGLMAFVPSLAGIKPGTMKEMAKVIGVLGAEFAALGLPIVAPFIILGANAMNSAGNAIKSLSGGMKEWLALNMQDIKQVELLCDSIGSIKYAFQGSKDGKAGGFLAKLGSVISGPFDQAIMKQSAEALIIASRAIKELAKGLSDWSAANIDTNKISGVVTVITAVRDMFAQMGARPDKAKSSLLKKLIGVDMANVEMSDVEIGARAVKRIGQALTEITKGLVAFKEGVGKKFDDTNYMTEFASSVKIITTGLAESFAALAGEGQTVSNVRQGQTLLGKLWQDITVNSFAPNTITKAEIGIKSVRKLGSTIKDIAIGLKEFKDIVPNGKSSFIVNVAAGISALLEGLTGPLIAFGTTEESFSATTSQLSSMSAKYSTALSSIQSMNSQTVNFEKHKVDIANAMKNIGQIGELVKGLAEGAKIMADPKLSKDIGKAGTITGDFIVGDDGTGVVGNIQKLVCSNLAVFLQLGKKIEEVGIYEAFHDEVVQDIRRGGKAVTNKAVRVSEGKKSYIAMAVDAAVGIGQVITNLAEGYKAMNSNFPNDKAMVEGTARVTKSIASIMTAFSTIGLATYYDSNTVHQLIPMSIGNPEMTKQFGKISGLASLLDSGDSFNEISNNIKTVISTIVDGTSSISGSMKNFDDFYKKSSIIMESAVNLTALGMTFANHDDEYSITAYHKGKEKTYTLSKLYNSWLKRAKENVDLIKDTSHILFEAVPDLSKLTPTAGSSFVSFSEQMTKAMNKLSGASTNIRYSTEFVNTLRTAVKENVFNNISSNTKKIADAVNSIDNEVFEPYAKMIAALGVMTKRQSEFVAMQKQLYELLEKIINKINEAKGDTGQVSSAPSTQTVQVGNTPAQQPKQQNAQNNQPLMAKLNRTSVDLNYGNFIKELEDLLNRVKSL